MTLPDEFLRRMQGQLGGGYAAYLQAMTQPPPRALRVNTLKTGVEPFLEHIGIPLMPTGVLPESFFVPADFRPAQSLPHRAGHCYMQDPSALLPAAALEPQPGMAVLDLCAAPGGKATQIAAAMRNTGLLVANEPVLKRARVLESNLERLGVTNTIVTCMPPDRLCALLHNRFDAVLADAPCSGEGMFRKDATAVRDWSLAHVRACAARQTAILDAAALALRPGGRLVYATCTFSPEENEGVVSAFIAAHPDFSLGLTNRVYPHESEGEGQFYARLERAGSAESALRPTAMQGVPLWEAFAREYLPALPPRPSALLPDGRVYLPPPQSLPHTDRLHILRAGVPAGEILHERFLPSHALAMAFPNAFRQHAALSTDGIAAYLNGESIACDPALSGWCAVEYGGLAVGLGKAVDGMLKNHLPKGLRGGVLIR